MHGGIQAISVWTEVPVATRTVEVNTKTGFSLTAGSYSVRASSSQRGTVAISAVQTSNTATISSVTTTRATLMDLSWSNDTANASKMTQFQRPDLTNATTVTSSRNVAEGIGTNGFEVVELF